LSGYGVEEIWLDVALTFYTHSFIKWVGQEAMGNFNPWPFYFNPFSFFYRKEEDLKGRR
jgi:hypothetical protein